MRLHLLYLIFIFETKQAKGFLGIVCKKLKLGGIWTVRDLVGKKGGMLVPWSENVQIKVMRSTEFRMEVHVTTDNEREKFWQFFMQASTDANERK